MAEYKSAILADQEFYSPYHNLARLYIVQRNDNAGALRLLDKALGLKVEGTQEVQNLVRYAMYKNHGWANLGLKNYSAARDDLEQALRLNGEGAEAYCLLAQVSEAQKDKGGAAESWRVCGELGAERVGEIEPHWVGLAKEKLR
jgi:tetratricopeptide (TPR) repeat protein